MKKLAMIAIVFVSILYSCNSFDNRVELAQKHVEEQYYHQDNFPVKLLDFEKTNGEQFQSTVWLEPGVHKIYKLSYTATFEVLTDGYIEVNKTNGSIFPIIYNEKTRGLNCREDGSFMYDGYEKKEVKIKDKIQIRGIVLFKKTEKGWVYTPE